MVLAKNYILINFTQMPCFTLFLPSYILLFIFIQTSACKVIPTTKHSSYITYFKSSSFDIRFTNFTAL